MSRVDVPTLRCDRCWVVTQDVKEMGRFHRLMHPSGDMMGTEDWDVCPACWEAFMVWWVAERKDQ